VGKEPLHLGALLAFSQGRWNRQGEYAAIYTACTPDGARAEWIKLCATAGSAVGPRDLVSIDVEAVLVSAVNGSGLDALRAMQGDGRA
jgi:hypothetical protein